MENPEGVLNLLDEFAKLKSKEIPNDLEEYLMYVAASGDPVYQWSLIKSLYRQKLINVITEFYEMCPVLDIPRCPNVDPFNYETMKTSLLNRLDSFSSAPFTIQRISELLTTPRKQYNRVDKFMRAIEKNIWVVSTREPGAKEQTNSQESSGNLVNGVSPRVCVSVKHPKRVKSIKERIKSGHPQLIDDDDDEDEDEEEEEEDMDDYEQMEEETTAEILPNNESDDTSLQCTSVKDLIKKYENGTIFSNSDEKSSEYEEKSVQLEEASEPATSNVVIAEADRDYEAQQQSDSLSSDMPQSQVVESGFVLDSEADTLVHEREKPGSEPSVVADSSSDIPHSEPKTSGDEPDSISTLENLVESQPEAEPSILSGTDSAENNEKSETLITESEILSSTAEISSNVEEEFQPPTETSDAQPESSVEESDIVKENVESENECV